MVLCTCMEWGPLHPSAMAVETLCTPADLYIKLSYIVQIYIVVVSLTNLRPWLGSL